MSQARPTTMRQPSRAGDSQRRMDMITRLRGLGGVRASVQMMARAAMVQTHEAALLLSVAATAPVRLFRGDNESANTMSRRTKASATPTLPVLLVHGFGGAKSSWTLVAHALSARGLTVDAISYAPVGNSVEQLAAQLVAEVEGTLSRTGADKLHLVGHSLGGVVIAQAILDPRLSGRVDTVITLGSPFGGSPWAGALPVLELVRALRAGSPLLRRLASTPLPDGVRWLSVTAALDIIVPGLRSVPSHPQVETITFDGVGHLGMLLSPKIIAYITAALSAEGAASAAEPVVHMLASAS
jgi:triacylglycerol lipase